MTEPNDQTPVDDEISANASGVDASVEEFAEDGNNLEAGSEVDALRSKLIEANERVLRSQAELENFRRRNRRELDETIKYSNQPLLSDLLPVVDNIERAIESAEQNPDGSGLLQGVQMVAEQIVSVLEKHYCKRIPAVGEVFDPTRHEAIAQQPSDDVEQGQVILVAMQGYQLHDRIVRPTQVIVSTGSPSSSDDS